MDNAKRELFCRALWQAFEEKRNEELAACGPSFEPSARHLHKVSCILGVDVQEETGRKYYRRKRVITLILAAVLLLVSGVTVYAYGGAIFGFVEKMFDDHVEVGFDGIPSDAPTKIEEVYELGYVPQGFVQVQDNSHERGVRYIFENEEGATLDFQQIPLNAENILEFDNEHGNLEIKTYGTRNVYCYNSEKTCSFLWRDNKYSMLIAVDIPLTEEEILEIMDSIQIKQ